MLSKVILRFWLAPSGSLHTLFERRFDEFVYLAEHPLEHWKSLLAESPMRCEVKIDRV